MVVKPHDPRQPRVSPEQMRHEVTEILGERPADLGEEAAQLSRAHQVLFDALQDN